MIAVAQSLTDHAEGLLAYAVTQMTSGRMEGINRKIKTLLRQVYGLRDATSSASSSMPSMRQNTNLSDEAQNRRADVCPANLLTLSSSTLPPQFRTALRRVDSRQNVTEGGSR